MIIRMSVSDNDFGVVLAGFAKYLKSSLIFMRDINERANTKEVGNEMEYFKKMMKLVNTPVPQMSYEDKKFVAEEIKKKFAKYVKKYTLTDAEEYLSRNFWVQIQNTFKEQDENGEVCYLLFNKGIYFLQ